MKDIPLVEDLLTFYNLLNISDFGDVNLIGELMKSA